MAGINQLIQNLQRIDVTEVLKEAASQNPTALLDAQKEQWLHGENAEGNKIGKYRGAKYYRRKKFNMNVLAGYGNVDLRLTGEFYRNTKVYFFSTAFFFRSTDWKTPILEDRYKKNGEIFGLNKRYRNKASKNLAPTANNIFRQLIHK